MIRGIQGVDQYVSGLAKALYTQGFDLPEVPTIELDEAGQLAFSIVGVIPDVDLAEVAEISLDEIWRPLPDRRWERREYTYDLVDRPRRRRRAFHLHDRDLAEAELGTVVHEHCEEIFGQPTCQHYLGRELPNGYLAIDHLVAAWVEPGPLGCAALTCLDQEPSRPASG